MSVWTLPNRFVIFIKWLSFIAVTEYTINIGLHKSLFFIHYFEQYDCNNISMYLYVLKGLIENLVSKTKQHL